MKIGLQGSDTEIIGALGEATEFKIKNSPIAFEILSSRLYNDKITAIIRELSCNAYDAHIAAGKADVPFEIHLPTPWEEFFSIKDFGTGLSHDDLVNLYCTYFGSNKDGSDDFIGAMGLGSKSPFCYTTANDQPVGFTVISRFEGKTRTYDAHISPAGTPEVVLLTEIDSPDEVNGLEITFPVAKRDIAEFENKAATVLEFFDPVPKVNISHFKPKKTTYALRTDRWGLRTGSSTYSARYRYNVEDDEETEVRAIMGKVVYSIGNIDISKMNQAHKTLLKMPIDLFFEIGELQPAVSRETLSNTRKTIDSILNSIQKLHDTLLTEIQAKINELPTKWQAILAIKDMDNSSYSQLVKEAIANGTIFCQYQNFKLDNLSLPKISEHDYVHATVYSFHCGGYSSRDDRAIKRSVFSDKSSTAWAEKLKKIQLGFYPKSDFDLTFDIAKDILYVINDSPEGIETYISYLLNSRTVYFDEHFKLTKTSPSAKWGTPGSCYDTTGSIRYERISKVIMLSPTRTADMTKFNDECERMLSCLYNPPVMKASDVKIALPEAAAKVIEKKIREKKDVMMLDFSGSSFEHMWIKVEPDEIPEGEKFYVIVREGKPDLGNWKDWSSGEAFVATMQSITSTQLFGFEKKIGKKTRYTDCYLPSLYALKPSSKLPYTTEGWVHFPTHVKKIATELVKPGSFEKLSLLMTYGQEITHLELWIGIHKTNALSSNSLAKRFSTLYNSCALHVGNSALAGVLAKLKAMKLITYDTANLVNLKAAHDAVVARYPLLKHLSHLHSYNDLMLSEYIRYISLIDMEIDAKEMAGQVDDEPILLELKEGEKYVAYI